MISVRTYTASFLSYCIIAYLLACFVKAGAFRVSRSQEETDHNVTETKKTIPDVTRSALKNGYLATEHTVQTEDGYILKMFRLSRSGGDPKGLPVLMMHGLLQSASMWIDAGPGVALAYLLVDEGYDVWLGNDRGNHYSRQHAWLNPDTDSEYWQFSVTEIGSYDLPAVFDYVLSQTSAPKLNYIGFSQGGGSFFVMCSERPEYRDKVNVMLGIAPATRIFNTKSMVLHTILELYEKNEDKLNSYGDWEVLPYGGLVQSFAQYFCGLSNEATKICETVLTILDAPNPGSKTNNCVRATFGGFPAGTSVHNMVRYNQGLRATNFQKFDYGREGNLMHYGSESPSVFNLSLANIPTVIIYGRNDGMVNFRDIKWLVGQLPIVVEAFEVKDPLWTHLDNCMSKNIPKLLYPKIKQYLETFN